MMSKLGLQRSTLETLNKVKFHQQRSITACYGR
jgi:hypothetical protein